MGNWSHGVSGWALPKIAISCSLNTTETTAKPATSDGVHTETDGRGADYRGEDG